MGLGERLRELDERTLGPVKPPDPPPSRRSLAAAIAMFVVGLVVAVTVGSDHAWAGGLAPGLAIPLIRIAIAAWRRSATSRRDQ